MTGGASPRSQAGTPHAGDLLPAWLRAGLAGSVSGWWPRIIAASAIFLMVAVTAGSSLVTGLDRRVAETRFSLLDRPASGSLVLVEIDAASLAALDQWPWSRAVYADAIEALDAAGAELIAFDVDFSARSNAADDARLAEAVSSAAGRVVLPTFQQAATSRDSSRLIEAAPHLGLAENALLASVNVVPDADGVVRRASYGYASDEGYRASLAATLAGAEYGREGGFLIDFGINPDTIPRVSFIDVVEGRADPEMIRGRNVLIGATALELGDEFVTPRFKIEPGAAVHGLAYESLVQGRALMDLGSGAAVALALLVVLVMMLPRWRWSWARLIGVHAAVLSVGLGGPLLLQKVAAVQLDLGPVFVAQALCLLAVMARELHARANEILSQRAAAARQQALIVATLRDSHDGFVVTDDAGVIEVINPQAAIFFQHEDGDVVGQPLGEVAPGFKSYRAVLAELARRGRSVAGGPLRYQFAAPCRSGSRVIEVTASRSVFAEDARERPIVIYSLHDVTARVRFERAEAAAKKAAEETSAAKTRFLSTMSHELRTPLNAVIGFSEAMTSERYGPLGAPQYEEFAGFIHESGARLARMVNGVLEVARLDAGEAAVSRAPCTVQELFDAARRKVADAALARGLTVNLTTPDDLGDLSVDVPMFQRVFDELITNAVEFAPDGDRVTVAVQHDGVAGVVVDVRNKAEPLSEDQLATLTQPFVQGDSSAVRAHEGAGLGLHLVERYVALHGGTTTLDSAPDGAFTVRLRLPDILDRERLLQSAA